MGVEHYENFPVASRVLPQALRRPVIAIYRFARAADDIADEGDGTTALRLSGLLDYARALDRIAAGHAVIEPPFGDLAAAIRAHQFPMPLFHDLLSAFSQDVVQTRYRDIDQLLDYCRRSANPIGRLLLILFKATTHRDLAESDAICSALQLINFWQDIAIDVAKGRVYIPQEDLTRFGVTETDLIADPMSPSCQALIAFEIDRARAMLESGAALAGRLRGRMGFELGLIVEGGRTIANKLRRLNERGLRARPVMRPHDWLMILARVAVGRMRNLIAR